MPDHMRNHTAPLIIFAAMLCMLLPAAIAITLPAGYVDTTLPKSALKIDNPDFAASQASLNIPKGSVTLGNNLYAGGYAFTGAGQINAYSMEVGGPDPTATNNQAKIYLHHHNGIAHQLRYRDGVLYLEATTGYGTSPTPTLSVGGPVHVGVNGGDLGVGTSTPENLEGWSKTIDMYGSAHSKLQIRTDAIITRLVSHGGWAGAPAGGVVGTQTPHAFSIMTNGVARMSVDSAGVLTMRATEGLWAGGGNKVRNGGFRDGVDGVATGRGWGLQNVVGTANGGLQVWTNNEAWTLRDGDTPIEGEYGSTLAVNTITPNGEYYVYSDFFKLTNGRLHTYQGLLGNHRMNFVKLRIVTYDAAKSTRLNTYYATVQNDGLTQGCTQQAGQVGGASVASYCLLWGTFRPAGNEKFARVELVANGYNTSLGGDGWLFADQIAVVEGAQPLAWTAEPWQTKSDGAIYTMGNVGIGTTSPVKTLHVQGSIKATGGVDPPFVSFTEESHESIREYAKTVTPEEKVMIFWNAGAHRMEVYVIAEDAFYTLGGERAEGTP